MADFQSILDQFESEQVKIIAGSVDPIDKAKELVDKLGITFAVRYGMDAEDASRLTGAFDETGPQSY